MSTLVDIKGKRFGKLLVLERKGKSKNRSVKWLCKCDCGKEKEIVGYNLKAGKTKSCGCESLKGLRPLRIAHNKKPEGESSANHLFINYKNGARKRNIEWNITKEDFLKITKENCFYCGSSPRGENKMVNGNGSYIYNGIDRKNNDIGYIINNCLPCCKTCNYGKSNLSYEEWIKHLNELVKYRNSL